MTCASSRTGSHEKLNKLDGVTASVNFATERARVTHPVEVPTQELMTAVEQAGYRATVRPSARAHGAGGGDGNDPSAAVHLLAALSWSICALFFGGAAPGRRLAVEAGAPPQVLILIEFTGRVTAAKDLLGGLER